MLITYLDDSGTISNRNERHYILAGVCIFERQVFHLEKAMNAVAQGTGLVESPGYLELHGADMYARRKAWRKFRTREEACEVICSALRAAHKAKDWRLFGVVVDKQRCPKHENPAEYAFEQICNSVDMYHRYREDRGDRHSGLMIMNESTRAQRLQALITQFRHNGHRWGDLRHFIEVPFFVASKTTRLVQYADLVCYALWRKYEHDDARFFDIIADSFATESDIQPGLVHYPPA